MNSVGGFVIKFAFKRSVDFALLLFPPSADLYGGTSTEIDKYLLRFFVAPGFVVSLPGFRFHVRSFPERGLLECGFSICFSLALRYYLLTPQMSPLHHDLLTLSNYIILSRLYPY